MQQQMTLAQWLFNPFIRVAGTMSLVVGLACIGLGGLIAAVAGIRFDGLLDMHFAQTVPIWLPVLEGLLNWIVISVLCYLVARFFGRGSGGRFVDIAGTQALARVPLIAVAAICTLPWIGNSFAQLSSAIENVDATGFSPGVIVGSLTVVTGIVWMVVLMWNAFSVACNMKGGRSIVLFAIAVVMGELVTKFLVLNYL